MEMLREGVLLQKTHKPVVCNSKINTPGPEVPVVHQKGGFYQIASRLTIRVFLQLIRTILYDKICPYVHLKHIKNSKTFNNTKTKWLLAYTKH